MKVKSSSGEINLIPRLFGFHSTINNHHSTISYFGNRKSPIGN